MKLSVCGETFMWVLALDNVIYSSYVTFMVLSIMLNGKFFIQMVGNIEGFDHTEGCQCTKDFQYAQLMITEMVTRYKSCTSIMVEPLNIIIILRVPA